MLDWGWSWNLQEGSSPGAGLETPDLGWWPAIFIWALQLSDWIQKRHLCAFMIQQSLCYDLLIFSNCPDPSWHKHTQLCQQKTTSSFSISMKIWLNQVSRIFCRFTFRKTQLNVLRDLNKCFSCRKLREDLWPNCSLKKWCREIIYLP